MSQKPPVDVDEEPQGHTWSFDGHDALRTYRTEFSGSRDSLSAIRNLAEITAASTSLDDMAVAEFVMAIDEICANIVEHGYEKHGVGALVIEVGVFADRIEAIVTDFSAVRFAIDSAPAAGVAAFNEEQRKRGLGLDIIRHCVDKVEYQWLLPQGNQTRLIKYYESPSRSVI